MFGNMLDASQIENAEAKDDDKPAKMFLEQFKQAYNNFEVMSQIVASALADRGVIVKQVGVAPPKMNV